MKIGERAGHLGRLHLDTSAHVMPGMQPEAAELFSRLVFGVPDDGDPTPEEDA